jgi:hypothetical protein
MNTIEVLWRICAFALCGLACGLIGYALAVRSASKRVHQMPEEAGPSGATRTVPGTTVEVPRRRETLTPTHPTQTLAKAALTAPLASGAEVSRGPARGAGPSFAAPDAVTETLDMSELLPALPALRADPEDARTTAFDASRFAKRAEPPPVPSEAQDCNLTAAQRA